MKNKRQQVVVFIFFFLFMCNNNIIWLDSISIPGKSRNNGVFRYLAGTKGLEGTDGCMARRGKKRAKKRTKWQQAGDRCTSRGESVRETKRREERGERKEERDKNTGRYGQEEGCGDERGQVSLFVRSRRREVRGKSIFVLSFQRK
jgi:hypothetical protein